MSYPSLVTVHANSKVHGTCGNPVIHVLGFVQEGHVCSHPFSLHLLSPPSHSFTHSCVHLLAELSQVKECSSDVESLLPLLAEACRHKHYAQHHSFAETTVRRVRFVGCMGCMYMYM